MYQLLKKILFRLDPEQSHHIALMGLMFCYRLGLLKFIPKPPMVAKQVMGLNFPNQVGLAAGLDKNGDYIDALGALGFGFIEIGTVTPKPQAGNPKPRLFRLTEEEAIINRMGFNNKGIDHVVAQLQATQYRGILGINIGKNRDTPLEKAVDDYVLGFKAFAKFASYITINISSPNTAQLRDLQQMELLRQLLQTLKQEQKIFAKSQQKYVPLVVKISPDVSAAELQDIATVLLAENMDGVIATNTTLAREGSETSPYSKEAGGLSGRPLQERSTLVIRQLHARLQNKIPIIASGGVMDADSAREKIRAGAALVQVYSGFIYSGAGIIRTVAQSSLGCDVERRE